MRCLNSIYHPNIDIDPHESEVCVNLLCEDWQPGVGLDGCVMAILYLFHHPNLEDALNQLFDDEPMDEAQFIENVRVSLHGGEIDGFRFDRLISDKEDDFSVNEQADENISNQDKICQETNLKNKEVGMFGNRNDSKYIILDDDSSYIDQVDSFGTENDGEINNNDDKMAPSIINLFDNANTQPQPSAPGDNADPVSRNNTPDIDTTNAKTGKERFWYLRLVILSRFMLTMARFYPQIWHKVLTIFQRFYNRQQ